jgi:hypothetical protein
MPIGFIYFQLFVCLDDVQFQNNTLSLTCRTPFTKVDESLRTASLALQTEKPLVRQQRRQGNTATLDKQM